MSDENKAGSGSTATTTTETHVDQTKTTKSPAANEGRTQQQGQQNKAAPAAPETANK